MCITPDHIYKGEFNHDSVLLKEVLQGGGLTMAQPSSKLLLLLRYYNNMVYISKYTRRSRPKSVRSASVRSARESYKAKFLHSPLLLNFTEEIGTHPTMPILIKVWSQIVISKSVRLTRARA